jgi:hypothetical protein
VESFLCVEVFETGLDTIVVSCRSSYVQRRSRPGGRMLRDMVDAWWMDYDISVAVGCAMEAGKRES